MTRNVSISIEGNRVKAIVAVQRGLTTRVVEQLTFPLAELESFLARERARDITVSADFRSIYQETILLPPVKKSLERQLLQSELKKKNPSITGDLAIVFFRTGDKTVDGRPQNEYYVYAVETAELDELTELFLRQGKRIRALYPNMLAVLNILPVKSEPFICHYEAGNKKNLFLIKNGKVLFTRSAPSIGPGVVDYDVQNINMTVNYCRQQLRIEPTEVLLIGVGPKDLPTSRPTIPVTFLARPERLAVDDALLAEYLIPLSALGGSSAASIMTDEYRHFYLLSSLVHRGSGAFVLASILLAILLVPNIITLVELRQALTAMRKDPAQLSALRQENDRQREALQQQLPLVTFMNGVGEGPSVSQLLASLSSLGLRNVRIDRIQLTPQAGGSSRLELKGVITLPGLLESQQRLDRLVGELRHLKGVQEVTGSFAIKDRSFVIGALYGGEV